MDTLTKLEAELSKYEEKLENDSLTKDEAAEIARKISRIKIKIFLSGSEE